MRGAEFKAIREHLRQSTLTMSRLLDVSEATVKNWEKGKYPVPSGAVAEAEAIADYTAECATFLVRLIDQGKDMILVNRLTDEMPQGPAATLGAAWWRAVALRAQNLRPHVAIGYIRELDQLTGSRDATLTRSIKAQDLPSLPDMLA